MPLCIFFSVPTIRPQEPMERMKEGVWSRKKRHMGETTRKNEGETWIPIQFLVVKFVNSVKASNKFTVTNHYPKLFQGSTLNRRFLGGVLLELRILMNQ